MLFTRGTAAVRSIAAQCLSRAAPPLWEALPHNASHARHRRCGRHCCATPLTRGTAAVRWCLMLVARGFAAAGS
eukprot:15394347-Alexandrium_andersonii.AAC.1